MVEEKSLKITGANKTFFTKLTTTINKILIPTKVGINGLLISSKRNLMIKAFEKFTSDDIEADEKDSLEKKYDTAYTAYLESLDKYVMDSVYKKVKNNTATEFEKDALSRYYGVISLKENEYVEYKFRKQKYLIELDAQNVKISKKDKLIDKYNKFYVSKMDWLYKGILKNYSIKLADTTNVYDSSKEWIYIKIFNTLEEYIRNILPLKFEIDKEQYKEIKTEYDKYEGFSVGKLDQRDQIEKNMFLLAISRKLFTHSLPLAVAEQCYNKIIKDARALVQDTKIAAKREKAYNTLINVIEEYNTKMLSTKVYWNDMKERESFKKFWQTFKGIEKLKETDYIEYIKQKEVLFIKNDMTKIQDTKYDYSGLIKYYKRKLVDYGAMKQIDSFKSEGKYSSKMKIKDFMENKKSIV
ncbi:MAG: hypothetical protein IJK18_03430 [Clostridia bacterium]|nr:hypothetical protein [Clostridia bacterium]